MFTNGPVDHGSIPGRVITDSKNGTWCHLALALSSIMVKWSNSRNTVAPSPILWCSYYWKECIRVTLNYSCQLYFPRNGVAPFPTPQCSSYWKRSLRVTFDYSHQLIGIEWYIKQVYKLILSLLTLLKIVLLK